MIENRLDRADGSIQPCGDLAIGALESPRPDQRSIQFGCQSRTVGSKRLNARGEFVLASVGVVALFDRAFERIECRHQAARRSLDLDGAHIILRGAKGGAIHHSATRLSKWRSGRRKWRPGKPLSSKIYVTDEPHATVTTGFQRKNGTLMSVSNRALARQGGGAKEPVSSPGSEIQPLRPALDVQDR